MHRQAGWMTMRDDRATANTNLPMAALHYPEEGWPVFPLRPRNKEPFPNTHGFRDATRDGHRIQEWWRDHPHAIRWRVYR